MRIRARKEACTATSTSRDGTFAADACMGPSTFGTACTAVGLCTVDRAAADVIVDALDVQANASCMSFVHTRASEAATTSRRPRVPNAASNAPRASCRQVVVASLRRWAKQWPCMCCEVHRRPRLLSKLSALRLPVWKAATEAVAGFAPRWRLDVTGVASTDAVSSLLVSSVPMQRPASTRA